MDKIEQVREEIAKWLYIHWTVAGAKSMPTWENARERVRQHIRNDVNQILQIPLNGVTIEEVLRKNETNRKTEPDDIPR